MKIKLEMFLPDIEKYTVYDWIGWSIILIIVGVIEFGITYLIEV